MSPDKVRKRAKVLVPWGVSKSLEGEIVEVWGRPAKYIKVRIPPGNGEYEEPIVILLEPWQVELVEPQPKKTSASA